MASDNAVKIYGITVIPDSTGIFLPTVTPTFTGADTYYDLNGRKVKQSVKGLYIKNGKKYVVKDFWKCLQTLRSCHTVPVTLWACRYWLIRGKINKKMS